MTLLHLCPEMHITRTSWTSHYTQIFVISTWLYIWQNCLLLTDGITGLRGNFDPEDPYLGPLAWFMRSDSGDRTPLNMVSTAPFVPKRGIKKKNRKHDLNQERIHGWPKYYRKNRKNKWHSQINRYPTALSTGQYWQVVKRLLTVIFPVDCNPPLEQLGPYRALEAHYKPLRPRQIRPRLSLRASSERQTMDEPRWNEKKTRWRDREKEASRHLPNHFLV